MQIYEDIWYASNFTHVFLPFFMLKVVILYFCCLKSCIFRLKTL